MTTTLRLDRAGQATVQDLGRPGLGGLGVAVNGAVDQHAARVANLLVGNPEGFPLVEVTGSELALRPDTDVLAALTGAARALVVDGQPATAWEPVHVPAGSMLTVPAPEQGYRSYLAVNGTLVAERVLGSVAPDRLLGFGTRLDSDSELRLDTAYSRQPADELGGLFRFAVARPSYAAPAAVPVTVGPEVDRLAGGAAALDQTLTLLPQSDEVGLRFAGEPVQRTRTDEILSRGVPLGAVEVLPDGGLVVLMRGRLVTAGYPVVAVVTTVGLDRLGQVRPGDGVRLDVVDLATARAALRRRADERAALARRVRTAFTARGLGGALGAPTDG